MKQEIGGKNGFSFNLKTILNGLQISYTMIM